MEKYVMQAELNWRSPPEQIGLAQQSRSGQQQLLKQSTDLLPIGAMLSPLVACNSELCKQGCLRSEGFLVHMICNDLRIGREVRTGSLEVSFQLLHGLG